ncbi:MAG: hypothetical protein NT121_09235 [Chloroflexi bacterium]|nr:hypothetical protein [Chloroflexota bacterium]
MDKKTGGIVAFVATILCCGLPGCFSLCMGLMFTLVGAVPGSNIDIAGSSDPKQAIGLGIGLMCVSIIFIVVPIVTGFFAFRKSPAAVTVAVEPDIHEPLPPAS